MHRKKTLEKTIETLCRLLSVRNEKNRTQLVEEIERGDMAWPDIVAVANGHYLTPALYCKLRDSGLLSSIPDDQLVEFLQTVAEHNKNRSLGILDQIEDIQNILAPLGITPLVMKGGASLVEHCYGDPAMRMMTDLDIMMAPEQFEDGLAALKEGGYIEFGRDLGRWHHHTPRMSKEGFPAALEPHFRIIFDRYTEYIPYDETTSRPASDPRFSNIRVLKPTWHLYHTFLHSAIIDKTHQRWQLPLRYLYDFTILVDHYDREIDWNLFHGLVKKYRHETALQDFLYLANRLYGLETPIAFNRLRGWWFFKKSLWASALEPETRIHKLYEAYTGFHEIYGYEQLKRYYGLSSKMEYPWALTKYVIYHSRKHLIK